MKKISHFIRDFFFDTEEEYRYYKPYIIGLLILTVISLSLTFLINLAYRGV